MRKLSTRVFSLVLAMILCLGTVSVSATKVFAAEVPTVSITPLVTYSVNTQQFEVQTSVNAQYNAHYDGLSIPGTLSAGTQTLTFDTSSVVTLEVFAPYTDDYGETQYYTVYSTSSNAYWVTVNCVTENGTVLKSETIRLSKYNEPQVVYNAPAVIDGGAVEHHAANPSVLFNYGDTSKNIVYTTVPKAAKTVTIKYVDDLDAALYTETKVLNYGDTAVISAPASYTANGNTYVLKTTASYDVNYDNAQSVYTFEYAIQAPEAQLPYNITINLVDENGSLLHTMQQSVDVGKQVTVSLPATYEVGFKQYKLAEGQAAAIVRDYASTESKTYTVRYELVGETAAYTVTINMVDRATGTVLDTVTGTVEPDGAPFAYDIGTKNMIEKDGVSYWVVSGQGNSKGKIVHAYGDASKTYTLYYSAQKDAIPESYVVTMRYICVNDNAVLGTITKSVEVNSSVTFEEAPATLTVEGKEYIRLNGQTGVTVHKYNDAQITYEIYYRDASIVVENEDIIYVPGANVNQPEEPDEDEEAEEAEEAEETDETEATEETEAVEVTEEPTVPSEEVEIIEEEEVPLANKPADGASNGGPSAVPFVAGGIGLIAIIVLAFLFVVKKRRIA